MWVILHHLTGPGMMLEAWASGTPDALQAIFRSGYLAVQTFFILSGFVLARGYTNAKWDGAGLKRFFMARFARVYPVYALSLLVVGRFIIETLERNNRTFAQKLTLLADYVFLLLGWLTPRGVGWNTPAWSLSCEFVFYLCFPLLFVWLRRGSALRLSIAAFLAMATPILLAHAGVPAQWKPAHHLSDFLAGIVAAKLYEKLPAWSGRGAWLYAPSLASVLALIVYPHVLDGTIADLNTALRPLNVLLLIGLALNGGWIARWLSTHAVDYLGQASYSMYILHVPLLWWYTRYAFHKMGSAPHGAASLTFLAFVVVVSIAAFELVEKPANNLLRTRASSQAAGKHSEQALEKLYVPAAGAYGD